MITFTAPLRIRNHGNSPASWHFVTLPQDIADQIKKITSGKPRRGRGSVPVQVTIGYITWNTSIFPDSKSGSYLLPIKASIRKEFNLIAGDTLGITLIIF
ncbi:MAG TPA: DUF1905 domain-containing protein [Candidatus Absconditabacterales bacterium]|nr:DUF1905 domain-containing protein [Candidatus Absconditabacterales bacterium]